MPSTIPMQVRIPKKVREELNREARALDRTLSRHVREILEARTLPTREHYKARLRAAKLAAMDEVSWYIYPKSIPSRGSWATAYFHIFQSLVRNLS